MLESEELGIISGDPLTYVLRRCAESVKPRNIIHIWDSFRERNWDQVKAYGILITSGGIAAATIVENPLLGVSLFGNGIFMAHKIAGNSMEDPESWGDIAA